MRRQTIIKQIKEEKTMSINACIYDSDHILSGCITDSVIEHFKMEFEDLTKKYFGTALDPLLAVMEKALIKSEDGTTADFLNCLKLITRKYDCYAPAEFVQEVSRAYHALVTYCCSQAVYDEVMDATLTKFREVGLEYMSGNSYGKEQNDCMFNYKGIRIAVRMRNRQDLYRFWEKDSEVDNCATVYIKDNEYVIAVNGGVTDLANEIVECIDTETAPVEEEVVIESDEDVLNEIIAVIGQLLNLGE
jgi:hypothetical protein